MGTHKQKELLANFRQQCQEHGLKVTPKRVLIYEELISSKDHPSPEVLFKRVQAKAPQISLDTVYRTLASFHEMGLVDMVEGFSLTKRFDPNQENHHHARCVRCQSILDFNSQDFDDLKIPTAILKAFDVQRVRVTVEGLCHTCAAFGEDKKIKG